MDSELRLRIKEAMPQHQQGQEEFHRETGIDIERDIQYVVAAVTPGTGTHSALLVARGNNFNTTELESLAVEHGGVAETYQGQAADFEGDSDDHAPNGGTLAFLEPGLVAIGDTATVKRAIDAQLSATSVTSNDQIMTLVSEIEQGNNAWAVGRVDALTAHANLPDQIARQIPPVKWFAAAGHINGGVSGMVRLEANDDEAAEPPPPSGQRRPGVRRAVRAERPAASAALAEDHPDERDRQDGSARSRCRAKAPDGAAEKSGCSKPAH